MSQSTIKKWRVKNKMNNLKKFKYMSPAEKEWLKKWPKS